ncbi:Dabb family protein [Gemmata sp. G18]|uniref:Dabb family protein n=1 Tax=Gemmata palustris TaxID=2822762 RepID=A0ABS5BYJ3_9BACT|nr:Dabb family protein [Gemmata palustris]MBP3958802.1 Dabb family protein [Gemmata palustris]
MLRLLVAAALVAYCGMPASADDKKPTMIGHMVYFKLKDNTAENRKKLVTACEKYLSEHPGTVFFSAGEIGDEFKRDVNDRDWDVALHLVFVDKAAHDKYAVDKEHLKFIDENKANWAKVRVFDSELRGYKASKK